MSKMVTAAEQEKIMREDEELMRKYAAAHGCGYEYIPVQEADGIYKRVYTPVRPVPCVRDKNGGEDVGATPIKTQILKIDEEMNELKAELSRLMPPYFCPHDALEKREDKVIANLLRRIAEEAADTITAITTLCEALGIDADMRDEAQRRVNRRNMERGRL